MAERSKAPDSRSGPRKRAWVRTPLLTVGFTFLWLEFIKLFSSLDPIIDGRGGRVVKAMDC